MARHRRRRRKRWVEGVGLGNLPPGASVQGSSVVENLVTPFFTVSEKEIIAVVGATGTQGGSVASTFLSHPSSLYTVRCLTRDPNSSVAQSLSSRGAEVIKASLDDPSSLKAAFAGAHFIFVNTDFWATYISLLPSKGAEAARQSARETEIRHAKNAAEAAQANPALERYIYSALGPVKRASNGKWPSSTHWETKAATVDYIEHEMPALAVKTSFIYVGIYATNAFLYPKLNPSSDRYETLINCSPATPMPIIDTANSTGPFVHALVSEPPRTKLLAYDSCMTVAEAVEAWKKTTGKDAEILELSVEQMRKRTGLSSEVLGGPGFIGQFGYMGGVEGWIGPDQLRNRPETKSYEQFLRTQSEHVLLNYSFPPL
ncbi:hypothetical protein NLU13_2125 [Sarocladium strictum]|uniref:NmrA-like domain-containing protein n=1 Tax=Sarocladium strictum TaxID=5046 RepID=A0AA39LD01_SARSR|nr:hypothetical protein NLU13_2125 [Sarocladium strictum]